MKYLHEVMKEIVQAHHDGGNDAVLAIAEALSTDNAFMISEAFEAITTTIKYELEVRS